MSISFKIVTPSLVITASPILSTSILSMPLGPSVDLTASAMAFAAAMLFPCAPFPFSLVVPSFNTNIGVCPPNILSCLPLFCFHILFTNFLSIERHPPIYVLLYISFCKLELNGYMFQTCKILENLLQPRLQFFFTG